MIAVTLGYREAVSIPLFASLAFLALVDNRSQYAVAKKKCGDMSWADRAESGSDVFCRGRATGMAIRIGL
jgi:hypothetical protein